jgi:Concanavalin A-like lectin/glucanases superfamily
MLTGPLRSICLVVLGLGSMPFSSSRNDRPQPEALAHFRFDGNAKNEGTGEAAFDLQRTEFRENALYLNGLYEHFQPPGPNTTLRGFRAICRTPAFSYESFAVAFRFKAEDFAQRKSESFMPGKYNLLTGGTAYRWFGLELSAAGNLVVTLNNHSYKHEVEGATLEKGKWTVVACSVDVPKRKLIVFLNGKKVAAKELPERFEIDVAKSPEKDKDKGWTFTDYGNGNVFHGLVDELLIYGRSLSEEELEKIPLRP